MSKSVISDHPLREAIDLALLLEKDPLKDLAARFGVSPYVLSRRKKNLLATVEADSDEPQTEIEMWLDRADVEYQKAAGDDDRRGSCNAILAALRGLEAKSREQEREAESEAPPAGTIAPISLEQIDSLLRESEKRDTPERIFLRQVTWALESAVTYSGNAEILGYVEQVLRISNSELLGEFLNYEQRRIVEGDRCDLPQKPRGTDELFSQAAN